MKNPSTFLWLLGAVALLVVFPFFQDQPAVVLGLAGLAGFGAWRGPGLTSSLYTLALCLVVVVGVWLAGGFTAWLPWPIPLAVAAVGWWGLSVSRGNGRLPRLRLGKLRGWRLWLGMASVTPITAVSLWLWWRWAEPELADQLSLLDGMSPMAIAAIGLVFVLVNPVLEDVVYCGVVQESVRAEAGAALAVGCYAVTFGALHWQGFPGGTVGVVMVGVWALALAWLRHQSGGLLAPVLAHVTADAVIFLIVVAAL
jgi:uncharacterized protein